MKQKFLQCKAAVKQELQKVKGRISIITDIATVKSMRHSFLGILAAYIEESSCKVQVLALSLKELSDSHTSNNIIDALDFVLKEYGLTWNDINAVVTDSGSNMLKAFRYVVTLCALMFCCFRNEYETLAIEQEEEAFEDDNNNDDEEEFSESGSDDETDKNDDDLAKSLEAEFDDVFADEVAFEDIYLPKHHKCAAHLLQLVLKDVLTAFSPLKKLHKVSFQFLFTYNI